MSIYRFSFSALWVIATLVAVSSAWAGETADRHVFVETFVLSVDAGKLPAGVRQLMPQGDTKSADSASLSPEQHERLLKAVSDSGGEVLPSPTLLLRDGTEAQVKAMSLRRYIDSVEPQNEGGKGQTMYLPHVEDAESGTALKVKAKVSDDGKYVSLSLSSRLTKLLDLPTFTFEKATAGGKERLAIQAPRSQEASIETAVAVADRQTLVLCGQTTSKESTSPQTLLILVRPTVVRTEAQANTGRAEPAAITIQTKLVTVSQNFAADVGLPNPIGGNPPFLDDSQTEKLLRATQASLGSSVVTTPSVTIANGQEATVETKTATNYVGTFAVLKDAAGKPMTYEPQIQSIDDGVSFHVAASAVPGQNAVSISADLLINHVGGMNPFTLMEKPAKLTVQQPQWSLLSANVTAAIPDKRWTVVSSWQVEGTVERETGSGIPVIGRLLRLRNRSVVRDTTYTYLLIRPEMLDHMPAATGTDQPQQ